MNQKTRKCHRDDYKTLLLEKNSSNARRSSILEGVIFCAFVRPWKRKVLATNKTKEEINLNDSSYILPDVNTNAFTKGASN